MIVYPERGLALNESAAEIVKRCDGTRTIGEIVRELEAAHGADAGVDRDVVALVEQLGQKGLLEP